MLSMMAEHVLETDIITIIPTFYNYQDIRTFYTVNTSQIFKVHYLESERASSNLDYNPGTHQSSVTVQCSELNSLTPIFISSSSCRPEL